MTHNPCARLTTPELAYEVWGSVDNVIVYFVLKKYKSPEAEDKDPDAKWYVAAKNPALGESLEYGDMYISHVTVNMQRINNPLCNHLYLRVADDALPHPLHKYRHDSMRFYHSELRGYTYFSVPKKSLAKVTRIFQEHAIAVVCQDVANPVVQCLRDRDTHKE